MFYFCLKHKFRCESATGGSLLVTSTSNLIIFFDWLYNVIQFVGSGGREGGGLAARIIYVTITMFCGCVCACLFSRKHKILW